MSTTWGSYVHAVGAVSVRAGMVLSFSPSTVTGATTSVTVSGTLRLQQSGTGFVSGNDAWSVTGGHSASGTKSWSTGTSGQIVTIATFTKTVNLIYGQAQTFTVSGEVTDVGPSANDAKVTGSITIPARPVSAPNAPSSVAVARVHDNRQVVSWANNPTTAAPYASLRVVRAINGGTFTAIANLSSTAASFVDTATGPGNVYTYQVQAVNTAGTTSSTTVTISTTPHVPNAPSAAKQPSGDVVVSRPALSASATSWAVAEFGGSTLVATVPANQSTWTHADPDPGKTWRYVILARSSTPTLTSAWSAPSNTIQLIAPPLAPSSLAPSVADPAEGFFLTWQHNAVDGTPQQSYMIESRATSADPWVAFTLQVPSADSEHFVPADTWSGSGRQWRVRTWGQHDDPSPYSATGVLTFSGRPVVSVTNPGPTHDSPRLLATFSFFDPEGGSWTAWRLTLLTGDGSQTLETRSGGVGGPPAVFFTTEVADGGTYMVRAEARDGMGLWSAPAEQVFTVTYAPPPTPTLDADFREDDGYTVLTPTVGAPATGEEAVDHLRVERATADGWLVIADDLTSGEAVVDMLPQLGTVVHYRAVAVSTTGSVAYGEQSVATDTRWVFINHGPGFGQVVRIWGNLEVGRSFSRDKTLRHYAGRQFPVERAGVARTRTYALSGTLFAPWAPPLDPTSSFEDFEAAADAAGPVCVRDPEGVRLFASTSGVELSGYPDVMRRVSLTLTQVDWPEGES